MILVEKATDDSFARFYGGITIQEEWAGYVARRGPLIVAAGGIVKTTDGRWFGFMDVPPKLRTPLAFRYARNLLKEMASRGADVVQVMCDETIPNADRFLVRLGFVKTDEVFDGRVIWEWHF